MAEAAIPPATFTFRGHAVAVEQQPRASRCEPGDTTGRIVWEASLVLLKWLQADAHLRLLGAPPPLTPSCRCLDLSAGAGLVPLALAAAGATVVASEAGNQLPLLQRNVARQPRCAAVEYWWGAPLGGALAAEPGFDLALCVDVLYIALRDGLARELDASLRALVAGGVARGGLLLVFEERLVDEEAAFVAALARPSGAGGRGGDALRVAELRAPREGAHALTREEAAAGRGGEGEGGLDGLFWEPPPVRFIHLTRA